MIAEKSSHRVLRSFSILLSSQLITWILTSIYILISPRYLGPENTGHLNVAYAVIYIIEMLVEVGMLKLVIREIARDHSRGTALLSALVIWRLLASLVAYLGLVLVLNLINYPEPYRPIFYLVGLTMILDLLLSAFSSLFQAMEQFRYTALLDIIIKAVTLLVAIGVVLCKGSVAWMASALFFGYLVAVVQGLSWSRLFIRLSWRAVFSNIKWLLWHGLPFWGTSVLLIAYTYVDSLMLSLLAGDTAVGWYSTPTRLFTTSLFLPNVLGNAVFPLLSRLYLTDRAGMLKLSEQSLRWLVTASLPLAVLVSSLSGNLIPLLYGPAFQQSIPVMAILGATLFSTYINVLTNQFLVVVNRQLEWTKVMAVATILNPVINLFLINYFKAQGNGAIGAAWSLFITETLMLIPAFLLLPRSIFDLRLITQTAKVGLACLPMLAICLWLQNWFIIVPATAGLLVFGVCAWALKVVPVAELNHVRQLLQRKAA